jgi:hypothetical protein
MNPVLVKNALEKVNNSNILVNLVSQRVRQLKCGGGGSSGPLVSDIANLGAADTALREIIENKIGFESAGDRRAHPSVWKEPPAAAALDLGRLAVAVALNQGSSCSLTIRRWASNPGRGGLRSPARGDISSPQARPAQPPGSDSAPAR